MLKKEYNELKQISSENPNLRHILNELKSNKIDYLLNNIEVYFPDGKKFTISDYQQIQRELLTLPFSTRNTFLEEEL